MKKPYQIVLEQMDFVQRQLDKVFNQIKVQNPDEPADERLNSDYGEKEVEESAD